MLDRGVYALAHSTHDRVCRHVARENAVLGKVLIVSCRERAAVRVHSGGIPTGRIHLFGHPAHHDAPGCGQVMAPGTRDHYFDRESDGARAGEVVVDGCRAVTVNVLYFADGLDRRCLVSGKCDHVGHLVDCQLIQQVIPDRVVIIFAAHVRDLKRTALAGYWHLSVRIDISHRIVVGVEVVAFDISLRHVQVSGSCCRLGIVGKLVRPGQEHHVALRILQLIDSSSFIALSGVALVISDRIFDGEYSLV